MILLRNKHQHQKNFARKFGHAKEWTRVNCMSTTAWHDTSVMVTSDHNMTGLENSENNSEPTLKKQPVRLVNLIHKDIEEVD